MGNLTVKESGEMVNFISPNANNITSFKVHFSPKQEGTGDPSPENVREIVGWNGVEVHTRGKNLLKYWKNEYYNSRRGYFYPSPNNAGFYPIRVKKTDSIYFSVIAPMASSSIAFFTDEYNFTPDTFISQMDIAFGGTGRKTRKIEPPQDCWMYLQIDYQSKRTAENAFEKEPQIEIGSSSTNYEPFQGTITSIDWTNNIGNIYGGYVDLITGELVQSYYYYQMTGQETFTNSGSNWVVSFIPTTGMQAKQPANGFCSHYPYSPYTKDAIGVMYNEHTITFDQRIGDATYWKNFCTEQYNNGTPVTLVYEIKTPFIVTTLSPTQLSTLKGQNNFWSNADYVEIEYELTETFDIQKAKRKIILNQPHVESTSGAIAKFDTDITGKIKECKINFLPVQSGTGDPTPTNVRPITGWDGFSIYQASPDYQITPIVGETSSNDVDFTVYSDGHIRAEGTPSSYSGCNVGIIDVEGNETIYGKIIGDLNNITFNKPTLLNSNNHSISFSAGDGILRTGLDLSQYEGVKKVRINIKRTYNNIQMSGTCRVVVTKGKTPEYNTYNVPFQETLYGGYVDLVSGELVVTAKSKVLNGSEGWYDGGSVNNKWRAATAYGSTNIVFPDMRYGTSGDMDVIACSHLTPYVTGGSAHVGHVNVITGANYNPQVFVGVDFVDNLNDWLAWLAENPMTVVYRLATPVTYQLTPQQLTTLRGINNIWSDANGQVEIKYWTH